MVRPWSLVTSRRVPFGRPCDDVLSEPQLRSPRAEIEHRLRHVRVAPLIGADTVRMPEPEQYGELLRVSEVFRPNGWGHSQSLQA